MNSGREHKSAVAELFNEWIEKLSYRSYLSQRRKVLSNPNVITQATYPGPQELSALRFAAKGLVLVGILATVIGWAQKVFVHEPKPTTLTDSKGRIANIERQLHFYLDAGPLPDDKEIDEIARSMLHAPLDEGLELDELQSVIEDQKRKQQGLPTKDSVLALARVEVLNRVYKQRAQAVKQQHKKEAAILPPAVVLQCEDAMDERLDGLKYDEGSGTVTNIDEIAASILAAPQCADYGTAFLESHREVEEEEAKRSAGIDQVRALTAIKILERSKELLKQEREIKQTTGERIHKLSEYISPLLPGLSFILAGLLFRRFVRAGKYAPTRNANKANDAYLFLVTGSFFWWNIVYAAGAVVITDLWKFSRLTIMPLLAITMLGAIAFFCWGLYILRQASAKLERFFSMQPPQNIREIYKGRRKIAIDIICANVLSSMAIFAMAAALTLIVMYYSGALRT